MWQYMDPYTPTCNGNTVSVLGREEECMINRAWAWGISRGLRLHFTVYPDLSPNTDIIPFLSVIYWVLVIFIIV